MINVYENGKFRKTELNSNDSDFMKAKHRMEALIGKRVATATVSFDEIKKEFTGYLVTKHDVERLGFNVGNCDECILIGVKYSMVTGMTRFKKYYLGNYFGVETEDIVFHTGICSMTGEYTLYIFENQEPDDIKRGFGKQSTENYYGLTYSKDGKFIRRSDYKHETSIL